MALSKASRFIETFRIANSRNLFTPGYLRVGGLQKRLNLAHLDPVETKKKKTKIQDKSDKEGILSLSKVDIYEFAGYADGEQDVAFLLQVTKSFIEDPNTHRELKMDYFTLCSQLCYVKQNVDYARLLTQEPFLEMVNLSYISRNILGTLFYNQGHYAELLEKIKSCNIQGAGTWLLQVASLFKIGTPEAYQEVVTLMADEQNMKGRSLEIVVLFSIQQNQFEKGT